MVSFRRTVRIAGGRFWCAACNSVNRTCSTSTLFTLAINLWHSQRYLLAINMVFSDEDKILMKSLYLKGCTAKRLTDEFLKKSEQRADIILRI